MVMMTPGFEETNSVGKYSIVQRKSWRQRQSWKLISVQTDNLKIFWRKKTPIYINISTKE
jgi:hypothetical protein